MKNNQVQGLSTPNDKKQCDITEKNLPLCCPLPEMSLWNSHPKVYIAIKETGHAQCQYCGCVFNLK